MSNLGSTETADAVPEMVRLARLEHLKPQALFGEGYGIESTPQFGADVRRGQQHRLLQGHGRPLDVHLDMDREPSGRSLAQLATRPRARG